MQQTDDPVKSQLLRKASQQREDIEGELKELSDQTEKIITNALIIGGALALTYILVRQFSGSKSKKAKAKKAATKPAAEPDEEPEEESPVTRVISQLGTALVGQATVFLLNMAKEKLTEYLQAQAETKQHEHS
jgi:CHASE3 domain sensor protein